MQPTQTLDFVKISSSIPLSFSHTHTHPVFSCDVENTQAEPSGYIGQRSVVDEDTQQNIKTKQDDQTNTVVKEIVIALSSLLLKSLPGVYQGESVTA